MKKLTKVKKAKLSLKSETVRTIANTELKDAAGGLYTSPSLTQGKCACDITYMA